MISTNMTLASRLVKPAETGVRETAAQQLGVTYSAELAVDLRLVNSANVVDHRRIHTRMQSRGCLSWQQAASTGAPSPDTPVSP